LTVKERNDLEKGVRLSKGEKHMIELKTMKAVADLSLVLSKLSPFTKPSYWMNPYGFEAEDYDVAGHNNYAGINNLERYMYQLTYALFQLHNGRLTEQRKKNKVKAKISQREVWKAVNKSLKKIKETVREEEIAKKKEK
jgi:hypothetical protein